MNQVQIPRRIGRPKSRPACLGADKGYSYPRIRRWLRDRGIRAVIPQRNDQRAYHCGRPLAFDKQLYRSRNIIERRINWIKNCRRLSQRYDKNALCYLAMVKLHFIRVYLTKAFSDTS